MDISKIRIENETYNIKDEVARNFINSYKTINVLEHGAKGDGISDDTIAIQNCIDNFPHHNIYFPNGEYLISAPLSIKKGNEYQVNLILEDNAIVKTNTQINALLEIAKDITGTYERYSPYGKMVVQGGVWNASNTKYGIYLTANRKFTILKDIYMIEEQTLLHQLTPDCSIYQFRVMVRTFIQMRLDYICTVLTTN